MAVEQEHLQAKQEWAAKPHTKVVHMLERRLVMQRGSRPVKVTVCTKDSPVFDV